MKTKSIISDLHLKFADKSWNETFQLVRRCMDKPRDESKPCEVLVRSLERLQEVFNVSSVNTTKSCLEMIAKQQRMGFHITEATCYLTADLFYLEVVLLPCGGVKEVKVAPHGGAPVPSESLLQLLRSQNFAEFSIRLEGLYTQYNIPRDNEMKLKLFASLQCLGKDLQQISDLLRTLKLSEKTVERINNGRIGCLMAGKEDCPLTVQFYTTQADVQKTSDLHASETERVIYAAQVTVGDSDVPHKLQMASVILQPAQLDPRGYPMFLPLSEVSNEAFPAVFLLKLQPKIPVMPSIINKFSQITDVAIPDVGLQWAPLPKLLMTHSGLNTLQSLPDGGMQRYIFPGSVWKEPAQRAAALDSVPFTHPAHIPALLELLRHQCAINTLLRSCVTSQWDTTGLVCDLHFEVLPESESSFSVTFQRPHTDSLAVLLVNVADSRNLTCTLFGAEIVDPSVDAYLSTVLMRCMSIPVTIRTLRSRLEELTSAPLPPHRPDTTEAENDHSALSDGAVTANSGASTALSQSASVPEESFSVSGSACYSVSELHPEINTTPAVSPYTYTAPVGVFSHWVTSNGQLSEPI
ncbi:mediator of RNA polymerase II transcription subunit 1 isoform X2 [Cheilinus undulatus]|uniref:mediator of RNA polymerase II transcription subunit 1 isoform X2 n=1 Tax=Cheilinus undulatus TaxID=241271 RepID=UPI001BD4EDE2|nr:mediator of RNA polymerase II transcription subunit 1 isoform X2 [Cheilinus undulatus]